MSINARMIRDDGTVDGGIDVWGGTPAIWQVRNKGMGFTEEERDKLNLVAVVQARRCSSRN